MSLKCYNYTMGKVNFIVDKRTELIANLLRISQCNDYVTEHFCLLKDEYFLNALKVFSPFKSEKVILLARKLGKTEKGFTYDNCIRLAFLLEDDFSYNGRWDEYFDREFCNADLVKNFLSSIKDFVVLTEFERFYTTQIPFYEQKLSELSQVFDGDEFDVIIRDLFQNPKNINFCVNFVPSLVNANHDFKSGQVIFANIGTFSEDNTKSMTFDRGYQHIIIHEFMHSFVNPLTENLDIYDFDIKKSAREYENTRAYVKETITRALTNKIRELMTGEKFDRLLLRERQAGFDLVEDVYQKLDEYTAKMQSWDEYFPTILNVFSINKVMEINKK